MSASILLAGLPARLSSWLAQRIPQALVEVAFGREEVLSALGDRTWSVLVVDAALSEQPVEELVARVRAHPAHGRLPIAVVLDPLEHPGDLSRVEPLVQRLGVERVFFHPVDPGEVARFVGEETGRAVSVPEAAPVALAQGLAGVWERSRAVSLERARLLARAAAAGAGGAPLPRELREGAAQEAHRLAGLLGTFGLHEGTQLALEAERILAGDQGWDGAGAAGLAGIAQRLAAAIQAHTPTAGPEPARRAARPALALFAADARLREQASLAAAERGLEVVEGRAGSEAPAAVLVELRGDDEEAWRSMAAVARDWPGTPLLVAATRDSLMDRVRAVQLGVTSVISLPADAALISETLRQALPARPGSTGSVLCLDDDEALLDAVRALLTPLGMGVHTETDPARFWARLGDSRPDLVILDVEMPRLNGVEVCRVLRADPRYRDLPVVFLTARSDRETVYRVFAAGADDYVAKPVVGPELVARLRLRMRQPR